MKLSFTTLGCPDWPFDKIVSEAHRMGFSGIEIRGVDGEMRAEKTPLFFPENTASTQKLFKDNGLAVVCFGTSVKFHDEADFDIYLEEGRLAIDVCSRMGIPAVRVFGDKIENEAEHSKVIQRVTDGIRALCEHASGKNVYVLLETHGDFNTIENVMPVVEALAGHPEFGIIWDVQHSDRSYGDDWRVFYGHIKTYIRHMHIKDHKRDGGAFRHCLTGDGDIPIADIVHTLESDGYSGWYSFEWEKKWHPELPEPDVAMPGYLDFMRNI